MSLSRVLSILLALSILCVTPMVFGDNEAADLAGQVTIRRTEYGVPHVLAQNERALGFGLAYAQAEDHMESIMELILKARGEFALHFGAGRNDANVKSDVWNRQYRIYGRAAETYSQLDEDWRDMTEYVPAVVTILMMPLTFSIANGIGFGFITFVALKLFSGRRDEINLAVAGIAGLFIFKLALG